MDWDFNWSRLVFDEIKKNLKGVKKELFLMYPRFAQMILDAHYASLVKTVDSLDIKKMGPNVFGLLKQTRKGAQFTFQGLRPLEKFGRFREVETADQGNEVNVIIDEDHDVQAQLARQEDKQENPEIEINPVDDVLVETIDQDFDSTFNEARTS
ncbi:hypothetical protein R6Q59_025154 [Mikania micrantha]